MDTTTGSVLEPSEPTKALSASLEALELMSSVGWEELELSMFSESLQTTSDSGEELGTFTVSVQPAYYEREGCEEEKCFLVHAASQGTIDGAPCGTSIVAHISQKLETLEQHHHEYIKLRGRALDKKTYMRRQGDKMVITRVITEGESRMMKVRPDIPAKVQQETVSHDLNLLSGFVSEASNLLIMRLLARRKIPEPMIFLTFDVDINLCAMTYSELGSRTQVVGKETVEVFGIERSIQSEDIPLTWQCFFLKDGHLASRIQIGSPITLKLTKMPILFEPEEQDPKPVFAKKPLDWQEDMQLYSEFLDRKEELISDHETYLRRHPEMKILLADFMQFLLLRKPDDVFTFAAEFFGPFSLDQKRGDTFMSSRSTNPFHGVCE